MKIIEGTENAIVGDAGMLVVGRKRWLAGNMKFVWITCLESLRQDQCWLETTEMAGFESAWMLHRSG